MPRGDGNGPMGFGPMTGRGLGFCAGFNQPGFMAGGWSHGMRRGRGMGRGRFAWAAPTAPIAAPDFRSRFFPTRSEMRQDLEAYREQLKQELAGLEETLKEGTSRD